MIFAIGWLIVFGAASHNVINDVVPHPTSPDWSVASVRAPKYDRVTVSSTRPDGSVVVTFVDSPNVRFGIPGDRVVSAVLSGDAEFVATSNGPTTLSVNPNGANSLMMSALNTDGIVEATELVVDGDRVYLK